MKKFLILLAIFCIVGSAAAVSAADVSSNNDGWAGSNYQDMNGVAWSQYNGNNALEPGNGIPLENQTGYVPTDANGQPLANATGHAAGTNVTNTTHNATAHATNATNATNATAPHTMLATGNPILILLGVTAAVGGYAALRKRN